MKYGHIARYPLTITSSGSLNDSGTNKKNCLILWMPSFNSNSNALS